MYGLAQPSDYYTKHMYYILRGCMAWHNPQIIIQSICIIYWEGIWPGTTPRLLYKAHVLYTERVYGLAQPPDYYTKHMYYILRGYMAWHNPQIIIQSICSIYWEGVWPGTTLRLLYKAYRRLGAKWSYLTLVRVADRIL